MITIVIKEVMNGFIVEVKGDKAHMTIIANSREELTEILEGLLAGEEEEEEKEEEE